MKIVFFLFVNFSLIKASKFDRNVTRPVNSDLVDAIHSVLDEIFFPLFSTVNIVTCVSNPKNSYFQDLHTEILQHSDIYDQTYIFRLDNKTNVLGIPNRLKHYNLLLLDNFNSFRILNKNLLGDKFNFRGFYLFVLTRGIFDEIQKMAEILNQKMILNSYAIFEDNGDVKILEFKIIREDECKVMKVIHVDNFKSGKLVNGTILFSKSN
jgi:hypothetical protein